MTLWEIWEAGIEPSYRMLPSLMLTRNALTLQYAFGLQESRFVARYQILNKPNAKGPARGFWQFEQGGGVRGVLRHPASADLAREICRIRAVAYTEKDVWERLETDDVLAAAFARLLMWTDAKKLPAPGDVDGAWALYIRTWNPGKPHRKTFPDLYWKAHAFVSDLELKNA